MKTAGRVAAVVLLTALAGCASNRAGSTDVGAAAPVDLPGAQATASNERPTDWKKLQSWLALRGLEFSGDTVSIDRGAAGEVTIARTTEASDQSVLLSREFLAINARVKAMGAARDAVIADPSNADAFRALGEALRSKRQDDKALAAFATASRLAPESAPIRADLADAHNRVGELDAARAEYAAAIELDPAFAHAHARLAILDYYAGSDASAWRHLREAERLGATVPPQFVVLLSERTPEP